MRKLLSTLVVLAYVLPAFAQMSGSVDQTTPSLPRVWIASTINSTNFPGIFASPIIKTVCASGCDYNGASGLQSALNGVATDAPNCNEIIEVEHAGSGFLTTVTNSPPISYSYACPPHSWVWVRPDDYTSLPAQGVNTIAWNAAGNSMQQYAADMWEIQLTTTSKAGWYGFVMEDGSDGLILTGLHLSVTGGPSGGASLGIELGATQGSTGHANHVWLDRDLIDEPTAYSTNLQHAIAVDAAFTSITDTSIYGLVQNQPCNYGNDYQDIWAAYSAGPLKVVNVFLGGVPTENLQIGGSPTLQVPDDVEIRQNYFFKDPSEMNAPGLTIKNLLEFKIGVRILVDGNLFQYSTNAPSSCAGPQNGDAISFDTVTNGITASGGLTNADWSDVTFSNNDIEHDNEAINLVGNEYSNTPFIARRALVTNDIFRDQSGIWGMNPPLAIASAVGNGTTTTLTMAAGVTLGNFTLCCNFISGFTGADAVLNVGYVKLLSKNSGPPYTATFASSFNGTATSSGFLQQPYKTLSGITLSGATLWNSPILSDPNSSPVPATAATTDSNGIATVTLNWTFHAGAPSGSCTPSSMWQDTTTGNLYQCGSNSVWGGNLPATYPFFVGQIVNIGGSLALSKPGFTPSCFNTTTDSTAISAVSVVSGALTISYPTTNCVSQTATVDGYAIGYTEAQGFFDEAIQNSAFYGGLCPPQFTSCSGYTYNLANNQDVAYWDTWREPSVHPLRGQIVGFQLNDNVFVTDNGFGGGQTWNTVTGWGAFENPIIQGNVFVTPAYTGTNPCSDWPNTNTCVNGSALNPSNLTTQLGMIDYASCTNGDTTTTSSPPGDPTIADCEISGSYSGVGPNIPQIIQHQTLGIDTTAFGGVRSTW